MVLPQQKQQQYNILVLFKVANGFVYRV